MMVEFILARQVLAVKHIIKRLPKKILCSLIGVISSLFLDKSGSDFGLIPLIKYLMISGNYFEIHINKQIKITINERSTNYRTYKKGQ